MTLDNKEAPKKTEGGVAYPAGDYACVPDRSKPSTWKLRLSQGKPGNITTEQLGRAAAAFSEGGHRGNRVELPGGCSESSVKARIRREYKKLGVKPEDMPDSIKEYRKDSLLDKLSAYVDYLRRTGTEEEEPVAQGDGLGKAVSHGLMFTKDADGRWWWFGIPSNNRLDKDEDILTTNAHRRFVKAIEDGTYEAVLGKPHPDTWFWHIPVPIAEAPLVGFDERGFLIAAGPQKEGELYDRVFERMAKYAYENPGGLAMSHGMPNFTLEFNKENEGLIEGYLSTEFTILPRHRAANEGTIAGAMRMNKEHGLMRIDDYKREEFVEVLGEDTLADFDRLLDEMNEAANAAGIPKKEKTMTEEQEVQEQEEVTESPEATAESGQETPLQESPEQETPMKAADTPMEDDEDEEEEEEEKGYVTHEDLESALKEAAEGISEGMAPLLAELKELRAELSEVRKSDEERIAQKAADTPRASFAALFSKSIVGDPDAQVDYHKERGLYNSGPEETDEKESAADHTGIPHIDQLISKQQGRQRVVSSYARNGQQ